MFCSFEITLVLYQSTSISLAESNSSQQLEWSFFCLAGVQWSLEKGGCCNLEFFGCHPEKQRLFHFDDMLFLVITMNTLTVSRKFSEQVEVQEQ